MDRNEAQKQVKTTFTHPFNEGVFRTFCKNLLKDLDESKEQTFSGAYIKDAFKPHVTSYKRLGSYIGSEGEALDVLTIKLTDPKKLDRTRTMQRNFVSDYLKTRGEKDAAIVAFYNEDYGDWRFSYVRMEYKVEMTDKGQIKVKEELPPARRYSFLVGENEPNHTVQQQIVPLLEQEKILSLKEIENAFNIESVTREFFNRYKDLFHRLKEEIDGILGKDKKIASDFKEHEISTANFAKKLMGQIVFLYFVQKKGWMGVPENSRWGEGDKRFLRTLFERCKSEGKNFFNDYLEPLFYDALNNENRGSADPSYHPLFKCRIPFLNGGLFEPTNGYDWENTELRIENNIFEQILNTFDLYNFTVREDEPLEKEVAVDPEMLGKVFENLLDVVDRKSKGAFYTPREIVHYMCQESLINYLDTKLNSESETIPKIDIEELIRNGIRYYDYAIAIRELGTKSYQNNKKILLPESIRDNISQIDQLLNDIKICDPAIGSGAFPVGMMSEIVRARCALSASDAYDTEKTPYNFKRQCIQDCIYGVDIDSGAVDIAKLRLWLSLIVDEEDFGVIQPLPNLDYKIMCGNSLLGVETDGHLFNFTGTTQIEQLKKSYFKVTDQQKKRELHQQIDDILLELTGQDKCFDFKIHFSEVFRQNNGFDVVIGNPPYVQIQKLPEDIKKSFSLQGFSTFGKTADLYCLFYEKGCNLLNSSGSLCFISSNKFFRAGYGKSLRKFLAEQMSILTMIDFCELPVFKAGTDPTIIHVTRSAKDVESFQAAIIKDSEDILDVHGAMLSHGFRMDKKDLSNTGWAFVNNPVTPSLIDKIRKKGLPLKEFVNKRFYYGIKTGFNEAFVISQLTRDNLVAKDSNCAEIIKPWLRGKDIKKWYGNWQEEYLIFTRQGISIDEYPVIKEYLYKFHADLEPKQSKTQEKGRKPGNYKWYEIQDNVAYHKEFDCGKIVFNETSKELHAFYDDSQLYINKTGFIIISEYAKPLLAILNSRMMDYVYRNEFPTWGDPWKGGRIQFRGDRMATIPILFSEKHFKSLTELVNKIRTKKKSNPDNDVSELEKRIDQIVYELYGLTNEEIAIVENSAK